MLKLPLFGHWQPSWQTNLFIVWTLLSSALGGILFNKQITHLCDLSFYFLQIRNYLVFNDLFYFFNIAFDTKNVEFFFVYMIIQGKNLIHFKQKTPFVSTGMTSFIFILFAFQVCLFLPYSMSLLV